MPNANPETFLGSYPLSFTNSNTLGSTIPHPSTSIHPVCLHGRHGSTPRFPLPPQIKQVTYSSALGSVNGKNEGRKCVFTLDPNRAFMAGSRVPLRSPNVMLLSTASPSVWLNIGEWLASGGSLRCTVPGITMRIGGGIFSIVRICTGDVC